MTLLGLSLTMLVITSTLAALWFWSPHMLRVQARTLRVPTRWLLQTLALVALLVLPWWLERWTGLSSPLWWGASWMLALGAGWWLGQAWRGRALVGGAPHAAPDLFELLPVGCLWSDVHSGQVHANLAFRALLGRLPAAPAVRPALAGTDWPGLLLRRCGVEGEAAAMPDALEVLLGSGAPDAGGYTRVPTTDGRWLGLRRIGTAAGGWILLAVDLTSAHQLEQRLREMDLSTSREVERRTRELRLARQEADQANVSRTRFLTAASHDLLQPMNAARLLAGSLAERPQVDAEAAATARRIEEAIVAAESILDALLEAGRLDAKAVRPRIGVVRLARVFDALGAQFAPVAARRRLRLRLRPTPLLVRSDQLLLQRLLSNLLSNALRYTSQGGVLVAARRRGEQVLIQVFDTGVGIEPDQQQLIFGEFRTAGHESPWGERGLGLGLALCHRTAQLLQHPFGVMSTPGRGSCFHLTLDGAGQLPLTHPVVQSTPPPVAMGAMRVLCVDDNADSRSALCELLRNWGIQALPAADFRTARRLLSEAQPQVLLVDYLLGPGLDGFDVISELRRQAREPLPAAVLSATRSDALREQAEHLQCELFLKPVRPALLKAWLSLTGHRVGAQSEV